MQGDLEAAGDALAAAIETGPDLQEAWAETARLKFALRDPLGALHAWRRAVHLRPKDGDGWFNLGLAAEQAGELAEAASAYRRALASGASGPAELGTRLATVLAAAGEAEPALEVADAVLARWPEAAAALNARGQALVSLGRIGEARESLEHAVELEPDLAEALQQLIETRRVRAEDDPDLVRLRAALERGTAEDPARARLLYGLAKALDDLGRYDEAFAACRDANRLRAREGPRFDPAAMDRRVGAIARAFGTAPESTVPAAGAAAPIPVFVLGLP
jgi:tetratricopeptide (TPR) repeat protein